MPKREKMPYRDCAGVALFNKQGQVFAGNRVDKSGSAVAVGGADVMAHTWQMPQGGIDKGEDPFDAALRELYEETSVQSVSLLMPAPDWVHYDLPDEVLGKALKGKYRGQRQMWHAMLFEGEDSEIDVKTPGGGKHPAEFDTWRWEELSVLPGLIVPFKRPAYEQIAAWFGELPEKIRSGNIVPQPISRP